MLLTIIYRKALPLLLLNLPAKNKNNLINFKLVKSKRFISVIKFFNIFSIV